MRSCVRLIMVMTALAGTTLATGASAGCYSPDGKQIAIAWPRVSGSALALISTIDGSLQEVAGSQGAEAPSWSPDGTYIAFATRDGGSPATKVFDTATGRVRALSGVFGPPYAWREDGRRLAGFRQTDEGAWILVVYNLPEAGVTMRSELPSGVGPGDVSVWLPETDDVAFLGRQGAAVDVYTVEGGEAKRISSSGDVIGLALSSDRKALVWARRSKDPRYILLSLYRYELAARSVRRLVFPDRVPGVNPSPQQAPTQVRSVSLSPAGRRLAVSVSFAAKGASPARSVIYSVGIGGDGSRLVRALSQSAAAADGSLLPFWSLDGSALAIVQRDPSGCTLATFAADGRSGRVLARTQGSV